MKKLLILVFALTTALSYSSFSQATAVIGNASGPVGSTVDVPITVNFSTVAGGVGAFDFYIDYNGASTTFVGIANPAFAGINGVVSVTPNRLLVSWSDNSSPKLTNGKLVDLQFSSNTVGTYPLEFFVITPVSGNPPPAGSSFISNAQGNPIASTLTNGSVQFTAQVPLSNWAIFIGLGLIIAFVVVRFRRLV